MQESEQEFEPRKGFTLNPKVPKEVFSTVNNYCSLNNYQTFFSSALKEIDKQERGPLTYPDLSDPRVTPTNLPAFKAAYTEQLLARKKKLTESLKLPEQAAAFLKYFEKDMNRPPTAREIRCNAILFPIYVDSLISLESFDTKGLGSALADAKDKYSDEYATIESKKRKERTKEQWLDIFKEAYNFDETDSNKLSLNHIDPAKGMPILHYAVFLDLPAAVEALCEFKTTDQRQFNINFKKNENSPTAMHIAAELGYLNILQILLRNGASLQVTGEESRLPLHTAAYKKQIMTLEELLRLARDDTSPQDAKGRTPLALAMQDPATSPNSDSASTPIEIAEKAAEKILSVIPENKMLVELSASLSALNVKPYTYLEIAITHRLSAEFIKKLLTKYGKQLSKVINAKNSADEITPLFLAVRNQCAKNVVALLLTREYEVDVNPCDKNGRSVLQEAITRDQEIAEMLLAANADVAHVDQKGYTTLIYAVKYGVKVILLNKILANYGEGIKDIINKSTHDENNTALHFAVQSTLDYSWKDICDILITKGAELNQQNKLGQTPLHLALIKGDKDRAEFLLDRYPRTSVEVNTNQKETTLMLAIKNKLPIETIKKIIMRYGANLSKFINERNNDGKTALFLLIEMMQSATPAELHKYKAIVELFLEEKHGVDVNICDSAGRSPLHQSLINCHSDIAKLLLANPNIKISLTDKHNNTTFMHAVSNNNDSDIVSRTITTYKTECLRDNTDHEEAQVVLALSNLINKKNNDGNSALSLAIAAKVDNNNPKKQKNNVETINILLANNADPTSVDGKEGKTRTTLFQSIIAGKIEIATKFIDLTEGLMPGNNHANLAPTQPAVVIDDENKHGATDGKEQHSQSPDLGTNNARPKLSALDHTQDNNKESVKYRVKVHTDNERAENYVYNVIGPHTDRSRKTYEAIKESNTALSLALIKKFPDEFILKLIDRYGDKIELVINKPNVDLIESERNNRTPLYIALQNKYSIEVIQRLLNVKGIEINSSNSINSAGGFRPLHAAISNEDLAIIDLLFSRGAKFLTATNTDRGLPDLLSAMNNKGRKYEGELFQTLIREKRVATLNALGMSPLHQALIMNNFASANALLNDELPVSGIETNSTALPIARLPDSSVDTTSRLSGDKTATALKANNEVINSQEAASQSTSAVANITTVIIPELPQLSLAAREKLSKQNIYGQNPLGLLLLNNKEQNGLLLHQLIRAGHKKLILAVLESKDFDVNKADPLGTTPLILAVMQDNFDDIVTLLLAKGAKPEIKYEPNRVGGAKAGAQLKSDHPGSVKAGPQLQPPLVVRYAGDTAVHVAARLGKETTLNIFKSHPVAMNVFEQSNSKKETPAKLFEQYQKSKSGGGNNSSPRSLSDESGGESPRSTLSGESNSKSGENSPRTGTFTPNSLGTETLLQTPPSGTTPVSDPLLTARSSMGGTPSGTTPSSSPRLDDLPTSNTTTSSNDTSATAQFASPRPQRGDLAQQAANLMNAPLASLEAQVRAQGANPDLINPKLPWHQRFWADIKRNKWLYLGATAIALLIILSGIIAFGLFCANPPAALVWTAAVAHAFVFVATKTLIGIHITGVATPVIKGIAVAIPEIGAVALASIVPAVTMTVAAAAIASSAVATVAITALATITTSVQVAIRFGGWLLNNLIDLVTSSTQEAAKPTGSSSNNGVSVGEPVWASSHTNNVATDSHAADNQDGLQRLARSPSVNKKPGFLDTVFRVNEALVDVASTICSFGIFQSPRSKNHEYSPVPTNEKKPPSATTESSGNTTLLVEDPPADLHKSHNP